MSRRLIMPGRYRHSSGEGGSVLSEHLDHRSFVADNGKILTLDTGAPVAGQTLWLALMWRGAILTTLTLGGVSTSDPDFTDFDPEIANPQNTNKYWKLYRRDNWVTENIDIEIESSVNFDPAKIHLFRTVGLGGTPSQFKTASQPGNNTTDGVISGIVNTDGVVFFASSKYTAVVATGHVLDDVDASTATADSGSTAGHIASAFSSDITFSRPVATDDKQAMAWVLPLAA